MNELTPQPDGLHWALPYIGLPWQAGAKGPDSFDCWGLLIWVQKHHFARDLPDIPVFDDDVKKIALTFRNHPERKRWRRVNRPKQGDAVLMRQSRHPIHVGLWVSISPTEQGVLHCIKGSGVVFQNTASLKLSGWQIEGFYRLARKPRKSAS
ncbi:NlpC/P60 family protein [Bartonella queenslandensis]|uniref:NlpC/P60 family protein n=1 Tax=Bartonella queenslandensis TaxID=481138 RepID=UPI00031E0B14|nr:NlpC/P60 family protein [Bartonella queenslandensis]